VGELKASIGRDVIAASVADPSLLDAVGRVLAEVTAHPVRLDRGGRRASAPAAAGTRELAAVLRRLEDASTPVEEIGVRRPTLDEVFLTLTAESAGPARPARERSLT
jgi:ABC-2 type transport system ATP-binding protein